MAEEHRCQAQRLCANNCGFFGSPATQNLCSKCYRDLQLNEQQSSSAKLALNQTLTPSSSPSPSPSRSVSSPAVDMPDLEKNRAAVDGRKEEEEEVVVGVQPKTNRCLTCRKRVGLTGFKCRCGMTFCGTHRYPEQHECSFDFKAMGKEQIARANPIVRAQKLDKI